MTPEDVAAGLAEVGYLTDGKSASIDNSTEIPAAQADALLLQAAGVEVSQDD